MSELFLILAEVAALLTFGAAHVPQKTELVCYTLDGHRAPEADCRAALEAEVDNEHR